MKRIFGLGSPLVENLSTIGDVICASALWIVFSLPVFTMGAFRDNFKVATIAWIAELLVMAVLTLDTLVFRGMWIRGDGMGGLYWVALLFWLVALTWLAYVAAYTARFTGRVRDVLYFALPALYAGDDAADHGRPGLVPDGAGPGAFCPGWIVLGQHLPDRKGFPAAYAAGRPGKGNRRSAREKMIWRNLS